MKIIVISLISLCILISGCQTGKDPNIELVSTSSYISNSWDQNGNYTFSP